MESKTTSPPSSSVPRPVAEEYTVRVINGCSKKFSVMRFSSGVNVDLSKWTQAKMERENNLKEFKAGEEDMPKFGAGSEYGREQREEARRKRYGQRERRYNPEAQPWILKQGGKQGKTYRGKKDMVNENSRYYMFAQASDKSFEAYPVSDWYNFTPVINYKTFNIDEAEEEFGRRDKTLNYFSLMLKKRLKDADGGSVEGEEEKEKEGKEEKSKGSKFRDSLTLMEDDIYLMDSDDDNSSDEEGGEKKKAPKKSKKAKKKAPQRKKQKGSDDEATEESDEGDFDGREMDYLSETSSDEEDRDPLSEKNNIKGIDEKSSESEEEEEEEAKQKENEQNKEKTENQEGGETAADKKKEVFSSSSDSGSDSDSSNEDFDNESSALLVQKKKVDTFKGLKVKSGRSSPASNNSGSRPGTPQSSSATSLSRNSKQPSGKRKAEDEKSPPTPSTSKKAKKASPTSSDTAITKELVARYLMRKPMSTKDLLVKLKAKNTGMSKDQIFHTLAEILTKLQPEKKMIHKKAYWSLKPNASK